MIFKNPCKEGISIYACYHPKKIFPKVYLVQRTPTIKPKYLCKHDIVISNK